MTARAEGHSLDSMRILMDVTDVLNAETVESQPEYGTYVHGLFIEGARWDMQARAAAGPSPLDIISRPGGGAPLASPTSP